MSQHLGKSGHPQLLEKLPDLKQWCLSVYLSYIYIYVHASSVFLCPFCIMISIALWNVLFVDRLLSIHIITITFLLLLFALLLSKGFPKGFQDVAFRLS